MKITLQDVFNKGWTEFIENQKPFCVGSDGDPVYRKGEHCCIMGYFIPPDIAKDCDGDNIETVMHNYPELPFDKECLVSWYEVQKVLHDDFITYPEKLDRPDKRRSIYIEFAIQHGLQIPLPHIQEK